MPALNEPNVRHLLRRLECADRNERVSELLTFSSLADVVDELLRSESNPPSVVFRDSDDNWWRGRHLTDFWLNRIAHDAPFPFQERMAVFWHGHFCSNMAKVGPAELMREQIDLFRREGLGEFGSLARTMATQGAMLRYLDNRDNRASSPNQNFARELLELFLLGVGNYSEDDVEAATSAWTGHTEDRAAGGIPEFLAEHHDGSRKQFLGREINKGSDWAAHGPEIIDVVLGNGIVPGSATNTENRGRPTREVCAATLSRSLWTHFADEHPPPAVLQAMVTALLSSSFNIRTWVRTMLLRDEFYADAVKTGLVRTPTDWVVSMLVAVGVRSEQVNVLGGMNPMGQELLFPPNVDGWKSNGEFVNAAAMDARASVAQKFAWHATRDYWKDDYSGFVALKGGRVLQSEMNEKSGGVPVISTSDLLDRFLDLAGIELGSQTRAQIVAFADDRPVHERSQMIYLMLLAPETHTA